MRPPRGTEAGNGDNPYTPIQKSKIRGANNSPGCLIGTSNDGKVNVYRWTFSELCPVLDLAIITMSGNGSKSDVGHQKFLSSASPDCKFA